MEVWILEVIMMVYSVTIYHLLELRTLWLKVTRVTYTVTYAVAKG